MLFSHVSEALPKWLGFLITVMVVIEASQVPESLVSFGAFRSASVLANGQGLAVKVFGQQIFIIRLMDEGDIGQYLCHFWALPSQSPFANAQSSFVQTLRFAKAALIKVG